MKLLNLRSKRILLNITPLIDVLFILIIFFVVSSTFLEQPGIKLELPKAASSERQRVEKAVLYITSDEKLFFGEQEVTLDNLPGIIKSAMDLQVEKSLIVNADQQVHHGLVVKVMDIARSNGVEKLVISADKE